MLHLRDMSQNIIGHFKSQQKGTFGQSILHQVKIYIWKNNQHKSYMGHLELSKSPRSPSYDKNWEKYDWYKLGSFVKLHETSIEQFWAFGLMGLIFGVQTCSWHIKGSPKPFLYWLWFLFLLFEFLFILSLYLHVNFFYKKCLFVEF